MRSTANKTKTIYKYEFTTKVDIFRGGVSILSPACDQPCMIRLSRVHGMLSICLKRKWTIKRQRESSIIRTFYNVLRQVDKMMRMRCWKNQWRQDVLKKWLVTREAQTTLLYQKSTVNTVSLSWVIWLSQVARLLYHFITKAESGQRSALMMAASFEAG